MDGSARLSDPAGPIDDAEGTRSSGRFEGIRIWFSFRRPALQGLFAFLGFAVVFTLTWGLPTLGRMSTSFVGGGLADAKLYIWDLAWWPHAIAHGMNPFLNPTVWAPQGVNMAWVTGLPEAAFVEVPDAGHCLPAEWPEIAAAEVIAFLSGSGTGAGATDGH